MKIRTSKKEEVFEIKPGLGATLNCGSDLYPYTVIRILSPKRIQIQADDYKLIKGGLSYQEYEYTQNPTGEILRASLRKDGQWRISYSDTPVTLGERRAFRDPDF